MSKVKKISLIILSVLLFAAAVVVVILVIDRKKDIDNFVPPTPTPVVSETARPENPPIANMGTLSSKLSSYEQKLDNTYEYRDGSDTVMIMMGDVLSPVYNQVFIVQDTTNSKLVISTAEELVKDEDSIGVVSLSNGMTYEQVCSQILPILEKYVEDVRPIGDSDAAPGGVGIPFTKNPDGTVTIHYPEAT